MVWPMEKEEFSSRILIVASDRKKEKDDLL